MAEVTKLCSCGGEIYTKANKCNPCAKAIAAQRRGEALEKGASKQDVYNYAWRNKHPAKYLLQSAKSRAKKKGWEFNLEESDIVIPEVCPVLGIPLTLRNDGNKDSSPSLDRIDSNKGYIKGNIQIISWRANNLKADGTLEEFIKLVEFMKNGS
jgi:hypothetical protein